MFDHRHSGLGTPPRATGGSARSASTTLPTRAVWASMMPTSTTAAPSNCTSVEPLAEPQPRDDEREQHL